MNLINADLTFLSTPEKRDTDFYGVLNTKVIVTNDNLSSIDINTLHSQYQKINQCGIPYHYVAMKNGDIYSCRPRMYKADLGFEYINVLKNSVFVLVEAAEGFPLSEAQVDSLSTLGTMLIYQESLLVDSFISIRMIEDGYTSSEMKTILSNIRSNIVAQDRYRTVGDTNKYTAYRKIVSSQVVNSIDTIFRYTNVPKSIIISMNPHIDFTANNGILSHGQTIFLPDNRASGYADSAYTPSMIDACGTKIKAKMKTFKESTVI